MNTSYVDLHCHLLPGLDGIGARGGNAHAPEEERAAGHEAVRVVADAGAARQRAVGGAHRSTKRRTASVTLWPPKPKLLLSATSTSRRAASPVV